MTTESPIDNYRFSHGNNFLQYFAKQRSPLVVAIYFNERDRATCRTFKFRYNCAI